MSMDLVSLDATRAPPESGEAARGKRLKSESQTLPPWEAKRPPWELKRVDDLEESDMSMYDDHPVPFAMSHKRFLYKNKAMIQQEEVIAQYKERSRNLGPYDAIPVPPKLGLCGGVRPCPITDDVRPRLIRFCNLALEKYNADNQGANFVFDDLVKSTSAAVTGRLYYITFNAKDAARPSSNTTALTFQAKVWDKMRPKDAEPEVMECSMKPT